MDEEAEFELYDPLLLATTASIEKLEDAYSLALEYADYNNENWSKAQVETFDSVEYELVELDSSFRILSTDSVGLESLMNNFERFKELYLSAVKCLDSMLQIGDFGADAKRINQILDQPRAELSSLEARVRKITPAHIVLQSHFQNMVYNAPRGKLLMDEERDQILIPAMLLRDKYFANPSSGVLSEYLTTAEKTMAMKFYIGSKSSLAKALNATNEELKNEKLKAYALELEVFALLEHTQFTRGDNSDE